MSRGHCVSIHGAGENGKRRRHHHEHDQRCEAAGPPRAAGAISIKRETPDLQHAHQCVDGGDDQDTEIRTQYLELHPERYVAETEERVQIRIGARSLTATGMLASLNENKVELKSNVRGKIAP
jgi:hypothetical protein